MGWQNDQILPITIWSKGDIRHKISYVAISPDHKTIITGSWDGNLFVWSCHLKNETLTSRWMISGRGSGVSAIACWNSFFVTAHHDGVMCHMELPTGRVIHSREDSTLIHNQATVLNESQIVCAGFYPDLVIIDAFSLQVLVSLQSRVQSDWVTCVRILTREDGVHVQGLTFSGVLKTWALRDADNGIVLESSSGPLGIKHCKAMSFDMERRYLLLVTPAQVIVFDSGIKVIFKHESDVTLEGGDFFETKVVFWTKTGDLFECDLNDQSVKKVLEARGFESHVPGNSLITVGSTSFHVCGDITGRLVLTRLKHNPELTVDVLASANVSKAGIHRQGLLDESDVSISCSIHVFNLNKFVAGCSDGSIRLFSATGLLHSHFFGDSLPDYTVLSGHHKAVRCLLYPHFRQLSYSESLVVSGSDDHSVCLWDISKQELLSRFCVHSGPVVKLLTPPGECQARIANTICSVGVDHSVAILSLRERRCVFFASQHPFPVVAVHWKPHHDFMLVKCFDGSVFVWELRTGILDRVLSGVSAEEVIYDCVEANDDTLFDFYTKGPGIDDIERKPLDMTNEENSGPVQLRGILSSPGVESQVLVINVSKLVFHLQSVFPQDESDGNIDLHGLSKSPNSMGIQKKIASVFDALKQEAGHLQEKLHLTVSPATQKQAAVPARKTSAASGTQLIPMAQLAVSLLHAWRIQDELDTVCVSDLGLLEPKVPVSFDQTSLGNVMSFALDPERNRTKYEEVALNALVHVLGGFSFSENSWSIETAAWKAMVEFNNGLCRPSDILSLEMLAALWQNSSPAVRNSVRIVLPQLLTQLNTKECLHILFKWRKFLPVCDMFIRNDALTGIAIILYGVLTVDVGFKAEMFDNVKETAASLRLIILSRRAEPALKEIAVDVLGRGFLVWEPIVPVDEALLSIFEICSGPCPSELLETSRQTLRLIAKTRLNQFLAFLKFMCKTAHPVLEKSKSEIIGVVRGLLLEFPTGLDIVLSDAVEVLLACIDPAHLRTRELFALIPGMKSLDQLHHSLTAQRIAIGMPDGKVVVNDLRTHRSHVFPAHEESVAVVRFSPDGKLLLTLSTNGTASLWQPSHGYFDIGLGQFRFRSIKTYASAVPVAVVTDGVKVVWDDSRAVSIYQVDAGDQISAIVTLSL